MKTFLIGALSVVISAITVECMAATSDSAVLRDFWEQQYHELRQEMDKKYLAKTTAAPGDAFDTNALILASDNTPVDVILRRTRLLLQDLKGKEKQSKWTELEQELNKLERRKNSGKLAKRSAQSTEEEKELYLEISALNKRIAFENPLLDFDDILFVGYYLPKNEKHMCDQYNPWNITTGGGLYILKNFKTDPVLVNVLANSKVEKGRFAGTNLSGGAFLSPDLSFDGKKILFAWSPSTDKCYHIFKVNVDGTNLVQLTDGSSSEFKFLPNDNHNDFDPIWLPNGRIVFISDRRGGYGRCHTKGKPTFTLHSMKEDGSDLICLSYHETNEWHPSVDNDGKIVYTRWDYVDRDDCIAHHLWTCYPDGRDPRSNHGNYPHPFETITGSGDGKGARPNAEFNIRAIPNSQKYIATASGHHSYSFGELIIIDPTIEDDGRVSQVKRITNVWTNWPDAQGPYGTAWPLSEDYYICNKNNTIILRDRFGGEQLIYSSDSWRPIDPIPLKARPKPASINTATWQGERKNLPDHYRATIKIADVYTADIPLPPNTVVKSMRIVQVFPKETRLINEPRNGYPAEALTRMSLGTVPVESDGSVYCEAPVGKCIYFQLLDENGLAVQSMRSATYVHEGEQMVCVGCHESKWKAAPIGTHKIAFNRAPSTLTPDAGGVEPVNFARLVKPVFEKNCTPCHKGKARAPDMSFGSLKKYAFYFCGDGDPFLNGDIKTPVKGGSRTTPGKFGASFSQLIKHLDGSHHDVTLTDDEFKRLALWLDLNSMELGADYNVEDQRKGKLVWPRIDVDPSNPQGIEKDYPLPNTTNVTDKIPPKSFKFFRNGSLITISNPGDAITRVLLFDLRGCLVFQWIPRNDAGAIDIDLKLCPVAKGTYILKASSSKQKKSELSIGVLAIH